MSGYSEVINLTKLTNNHTNVELAFRQRNEIVVDCVDGGHCATNVNNLPLPIYAFLSESQASHVSFHAPSGDWNERLWGQQPITSDSSFINHQGSVHTSIAATVNVSHWPILRSQLATLLRMPFNPSRVDINQHPMKLSDGRTGVTQHKQATFTQVFPLLSANADTWKAWVQNLLPCKGKSGIGALLDAHTLHDSLWYTMSLDITIHRTPSVSQYNHDTCEDNASTATENEKVCTASTKTDNFHMNYLDETIPGTYNVEVKVNINMVVPITTAESSEEVQNIHKSATYNKEKQDVNILHSIQRASYSTDDRTACSINDPKPSTNVGIRYYDGIDFGTFSEIPLYGVGKGENGANKIPADRFWDNLYSNNGFESMKSGTAEGDYKNSTLAVCNRDLTLRRKVFDSRSMEFKVLTTILPRANNPAHACLNTTNTNTFYEPIPDSNAIDLSLYRYLVVDNSGNTLHNITSEGFVHDLPGFQYINQDCETNALSNNSRPQSRASSVPTCQPGYTFPLPDLPPHSALLLTYTANKRLLSREYQPIDASRGAVVPPAVLYTCNGPSGCSVQSTKSFIVTSPIPDSSMPYNVITLVSTLLAFFLGSFINALHKNNKKSAPVG